MSPPVLLVLSHLRWGFVYQRPQHLLSRLAAHWRVLFVEEPVHGVGPPRLLVRDEGPGLSVLAPHTPVAAPGFHDDQLAPLRHLLAQYLREQRLQVDLAWLYTPMALPLVEGTGARGLVYDCMDELSAFKDAPRQLRQRESALLKSASLVLTGGPSLFEAKRGLNPHVHCLPSAVDAAHFAPEGLQAGSEPDRQAAQLQGTLAQPRLGYYGVIDERLDLALVADVADAHPEWSVVMAGPVLKIDPATLPQRPNLHWLGMQPYGRLPYLLAGWNLCLMPFAINESTRFISPTKTLEYMAGGKPVVSTPVRDVIMLYGQAVAVAERGPEFIHACETLLNERGDARFQRASEMLNTVSTSSWDRTAESVQQLLSQALTLAAPVAAPAVARTPTVPAWPVPAQAQAAPAPARAAGRARGR
jgi:glycosyltransferase involved in cell wall biosynthesis